MRMPQALARHGQLILMALRAAIWRKTAAPPVLSFGGFAIWCVLALGADLFTGLVSAGAAERFDPYGLDALIAWRASLLFLTVFFVPRPYRATLLSASLALWIGTDLGSLAIPFALSELPLPDLERVWGIEARHSQAALWGVYLLWSAGTVLALFRSVIVERSWGRLGRAAGYFVTAFLVTYLFPHLPVFEPPDFQLASANVWEAQRAAVQAHARASRPQIDAAHVVVAQPAMLESAVGRLKPQRDGVADIYTIGIAGFSREDVFVRELNGALNALGGVLPLEGRVLRLVNHPATLNAAPLATLQNVAAAIHAIGGVMNRQEDILLLFMTSHGSPEGFALAMEDVGFATLRPNELAALLDAEGIKNRLVIVSACYAGIFVKPLANDDSIVLTAADENNPSFGCSSEREWTYFGDALFNHSLARGKALAQSFADAKELIAGWEAQDKLSASNPQGFFGPALSAKLQSLYLPAAEPVWPAPALQASAPWPAPAAALAPWPALPAARTDDSIWGKPPQSQ